MITMEALQEVFRDIFDDEELIIHEGTNSDDIEDWDSLVHIQLLVTIEKRFGIKFTTQEVAHLQNVGEMLQVINSKKEDLA